MEVSPYLNFSGQCAAAFKFYEKVLGGKITFIQTHGESPMKDQVPADWQGKVMHARLEIGGAALMGTDAPPTHFQKPQGFSVSLTFKTPAESERAFKALSESGKITMPYQKTFWSPGFGMVTDRFGIPWMINCDQPA